MKILYVEDDAIIRKFFTKILKNNRFDILDVGSGLEALNLLKSGTLIDLIISDVIMPKVDGIKLLKFIRNSNRYKDIPVILTTSIRDKETIIEAKKLGVDGYLIKPISVDSLIARIREVKNKIPSTVLIVDDEELIRSLLTKVLEREGFRVETAIDGVDAMKKLENKDISIILSDIKMPNMDGKELLVNVKESYPQIPVLLMTGYGLEFSKEQAIAAGANDYISKPFKNIEIASKIRNCLKQLKRVEAKMVL